MWSRGEKLYKIVVGKAEKRGQLVRPKPAFKNNIKIDVIQIGSNYVCWLK
jgi:hypothetical protein